MFIFVALVCAIYATSCKTFFMSILRFMNEINAPLKPFRLLLRNLIIGFLSLGIGDIIKKEKARLCYDEPSVSFVLTVL